MFETPIEYYRKIYYDSYDTVVMSLKERFHTGTASFLNDLESFAVGRAVEVPKIITFYHDDFNEKKLVDDRDMFLQLAIRRGIELK